MADVRTTVPNQYDYVISTSTNFPLPVSGLNKLIQLITYAIKTSPKDDIFATDYGMGLRDILPTAAHTITEQRARSDVARNLSRIEDDIKRLQDEETNTTSETLQSLTLLNVEFDVENAIWEVSVRVTSVAGENARVTLTP